MKTHEEHLSRVDRRHNGKVVPVSRYTHSYTRMEYRCGIDPSHSNWWAYAHNVEAGTGCKVCRDQARTLSEDEYRKRVKEAHGDSIIPVEPYQGMNVKTLYRCIEHGDFRAKPGNVIHNGSGCLLCYQKTIGPRCRKTHTSYLQEIPSEFKVLESYQTAKTPLLHECSKGHRWKASPNQILCGAGCPVCDTSQYRRRPIEINGKIQFLQGLEPKAVQILLERGCPENDLVFSSKKGLPVFKYRFEGKWRKYIPDIYRPSHRLVIEVKSLQTFGVYDEAVYLKVRAKARAVVRSDFNFKLMLLHREHDVDLGSWHRLSWKDAIKRVKERVRNA